MNGLKMMVDTNYFEWTLSYLFLHKFVTDMQKYVFYAYLYLHLNKYVTTQVLFKFVKPC